MEDRSSSLVLVKWAKCVFFIVLYCFVAPQIILVKEAEALREHASMKGRMWSEPTLRTQRRPAGSDHTDQPSLPREGQNVVSGHNVTPDRCINPHGL